MTDVPQPPEGHQASRPSILDTPRGAFVFRMEAMEACVTPLSMTIAGKRRLTVASIALMWAGPLALVVIVPTVGLASHVRNLLEDRLHGMPTEAFMAVALLSLALPGGLGLALARSYRGLSWKDMLVVVAMTAAAIFVVSSLRTPAPVPARPTAEDFERACRTMGLAGDDPSAEAVRRCALGLEISAQLSARPTDSVSARLVLLPWLVGLGLSVALIQLVVMHLREATKRGLIFVFFRGFEPGGAKLARSRCVIPLALLGRLELVRETKGYVAAEQSLFGISEGFALPSFGEYVLRDDEWRERVAAVLRIADAAVIDVGGFTENLVWELREAAARLGKDRFLFVAAGGSADPAWLPVFDDLALTRSRTLGSPLRPLRYGTPLLGGLLFRLQLCLWFVLRYRSLGARATTA